MTEVDRSPVCLFHGLPITAHVCAVCCLCFASLAPDTCWRDAHDRPWDVCRACAASDAWDAD